MNENIQANSTATVFLIDDLALSASLQDLQEVRKPTFQEIAARIVNAVGVKELKGCGLKVEEHFAKIKNKATELSALDIDQEFISFTTTSSNDALLEIMMLGLEGIVMYTLANSEILHYQSQQTEKLASSAFNHLADELKEIEPQSDVDEALLMFENYCANDTMVLAYDKEDVMHFLAVSGCIFETAISNAIEMCI